MDRSDELSEFGLKVVDSLPLDLRKDIEDFLLELTALTQAEMPIRGPTISKPWQADSNTQVDEEEGLIKQGLQKLLAEVIEKQDRKQFLEEGIYTFSKASHGKSGNRKEFDTIAKSIDSDGEKSEEADIEIAEEQLSIKSENLRKLDYHSYFGKGKEKVDTHCCLLPP